MILCPALIAGGLERVLSVLSNTMVSHYDEVTYITWYDLPVFYDIDKRVRIVCAEKKSGSHSLCKRMKWLRQYVKEEKPDIMVSFSTPFNMISLVALLGLGIKVVVSERNDPAHFRRGWLARIARNILYLKADGLLVQTETSKKHLWKPLSKRAVVIPNPVMIDSDILGNALRAEKEHIILTASRLVPQKRNDLLIKVFACFSKTHPKYKLYIYGDGPEREKLIQQISDLGIEDRAYLPGSITNLWERMLNVEIFVMTSEYEGMSNSLLEAMTLGLPCISTKVSGALDIIKDGINGLLIDINDEKALLNAMTLLADHSDTRERLGKQARLIADEYHFMKVSGLWMDYIDIKIKSNR